MHPILHFDFLEVTNRAVLQISDGNEESQHVINAQVLTWVCVIPLVLRGQPGSD